jgi:hypothetical protein
MATVKNTMNVASKVLKMRNTICRVSELYTKATGGVNRNSGRTQPTNHLRYAASE